jgi:hypothetical protein
MVKTDTSRHPFDQAGEMTQLIGMHERIEGEPAQ